MAESRERRASNKVLDEANTATPGLSIHQKQAQEQRRKEALARAVADTGLAPSTKKSTTNEHNMHKSIPTPRTSSKRTAHPTSDDGAPPVKKTRSVNSYCSDIQQ